MILLAFSRSVIVDEDDSFVGAGIASKPWLLVQLPPKQLSSTRLKVKKNIIISTVYKKTRKVEKNNA